MGEDNEIISIDVTREELGALLYLVGTEIGWLRAKSDETPEFNNEIEFYKALAFKLNNTI